MQEFKRDAILNLINYKKLNILLKIKFSDN